MGLMLLSNPSKMFGRERFGLVSKSSRTQLHKVEIRRISRSLACGILAMGHLVVNLVVESPTYLFTLHVFFLLATSSIVSGFHIDFCGRDRQVLWH
jgi:hypothetical protein